MTFSSIETSSRVDVDVNSNRYYDFGTLCTFCCLQDQIKNLWVSFVHCDEKKEVFARE